MGLNLTMPDGTPITGVTDVSTRPLTEGTPYTLVDTQESEGGIYSVLDDISTTVLNGVSAAASIITNRELSRLNTGAESTQTTVGDPDDNTGNVENGDQEGFMQKYKTEMIVGGAVLGLLTLLLIVKDD